MYVSTQGLFGIIYIAVPSLEEDFHALLPAEAKPKVNGRVYF
jgi:hypothetical protein